MKFCPQCATPLAPIEQMEDSGPKTRLRCPACAFTHWNNPTPVLAAVVECVDRDGQILLARNAAWTHRMFALITGFMEAGESPQDGIAREVAEETGLQVDAVSLIGVYDFQRMNQVIIAYHAPARGEIRLSPELSEYKLFAPADVRCWPAGTGYALADWLRSRGHEPQFMDFQRRA
jgi:NAD+ diphosphatase